MLEGLHRLKSFCGGVWSSGLICTLAANYRRAVPLPSTLTLPPTLTHVSEPAILAKPMPYCAQELRLAGCNVFDFDEGL